MTLSLFLIIHKPALGERHKVLLGRGGGGTVSIRKPDPMGMDMMYHYMKHGQPLTHMPDTVINSLGI
jgi:hypothetical protein